MEKTEKIVILISGEPGAGNTTISRELAKKLNLDFFTPGILYKGLAKGKEKNETEAALAVWKTKKGSSKKFHQDLDKLQIEMAKKGNVIIHGKLSIHFLKKYSTLSIWLDVPLEVRARRAAERDGSSYAAALKNISEKGEIERKEWKRIYGFDYVEQKKDADFVIDTSEMSVDEAVRKILVEMKKRNIY